MELALIIESLILLIMGIMLYIFSKKSNNFHKELNFFKKEREYNNEAMIMFNKEDKILYANYAAKEMFLLNRKNEVASIGRRIDLKLPHQEPEEFFGLLKHMDIPEELEFKLEHASLIVSGKTKKVDLFVDKSHWDDKNLITCVVDATPRKEVNSNESKLGAIDFLTGLPTQFAALNDINSIIIKCKEKSDVFGLFVVGIDDFENIQNTFGLGYTNQMLKTIGHYFIDNPDENMTVYRMEHDKFLIHVMYLDDADMAHTLARKTILLVSNIFRNHNEVRITTSIGIALYPNDGPNAIKLIDNAYIALNKAQKQGESHVEMFTLENKATLSEEIEMNEAIKEGLAKKEFVLYYQPIYDLDGEIMIGVEALLRWNHPKQGILSADKFLDVAERTGLIADLGEYVFEEAIKERQRCNDWVIKTFQITINISLKEMQIRNLLSRLEGLFNKYDVRRSTINLDISESAAMENIDKTLNDFELLREFGLTVSLEHFGTGYSSIKYLEELHIEMIKIDRSLISGVAMKLDNQKTVKAIIDLGHTLGYRVVAEGVETVDEASFLKRLKCDFAQGYFYSKPVPASELEGLLN